MNQPEVEERGAGALDRIVHREPFASGGMSGSLLERGRLDDGTPVVIKHVETHHDWIMQATGDQRRVAALWDEGIFDRLPHSVDHAMLDVRSTPGGAIVVMKDMSPFMFGDDGSALRSSHHRMLAAATGIHQAFDAPPRTQLCALRDLYALLSPQSAARFATDHDVPRDAVEGWSRFPHVVPRDVYEAVSAVHNDPDGLADALLARPCGLVHGDLKMANLGATVDRVVIVDWGTVTTWAPPAVEYAWYLAVNGAALGGSHDDLLDEIRQTDAGDDDVALRLALLGALAELGWAKALGATSDDTETRHRERGGLAWWCVQVRKAVEVWPL
ncbi:MAG TPA: hypothetical protein VF155_07605 [Candidatus Dormibacteraeota bacterium]